MVYLDCAASRPPISAALDAFCEISAHYNPSSAHALGKKSADILTDARQTVADELGVGRDEVYFTSGGTESNAMAILGQPRPGHAVTTAIEHPSVIEQFKILVARGWGFDIAPPARNGHMDAQSVIAKIRPDTSFLSCMAVCNETGATLPIREIFARAKEISPNIVCHTDAAQGFLKTDLKDCGADLISLSAHKIGGVRGTGVLAVKNGTKITPLWGGGGQERKLRAGTENAAGAAAMAAAVRAKPDDIYYVSELKRYALELLAPIVTIIPPHSAPHILSFAAEGVPGAVAQRMLSDAGYCVSTGAACGRGKPGVVFSAMKLPKAVIDSALRMSFCNENTPEDIAGAVNALKTVISRVTGGAGGR